MATYSQVVPLFKLTKRQIIYKLNGQPFFFFYLINDHTYKNKRIVLKFQSMSSYPKTQTFTLQNAKLNQVLVTVCDLKWQKPTVCIWQFSWGYDNPASHVLIPSKTSVSGQYKSAFLRETVNRGQNLLLSGLKMSIIFDLFSLGHFIEQFFGIRCCRWSYGDGKGARYAHSS